MKPSSVFLFCIALFLLIFVFVVKCLHFYRCDYTSDLFIHLQISRDWFQGKPMFYENCYGFHNHHHNYFFDPLMFVVTYFLSAYGMFVILFLLLGIALYQGLKWLDQKSVSTQSKFLFLLFYCSPLTYFIIHNEHYGFHTEVLYIPLCLLFVLSLYKKSRWYFLWALLIVMVKEDGAAVLWSCWVALKIIQWKEMELGAIALLKRLILPTVICGVLFIGGFAWLKYQNSGGETRMGWVMQSLVEQPGERVLHSLKYLLSQRVQLTLGFILILFLYSGWRTTLMMIIVSFPILILNFLSGSLYLDADGFMIRNYFSLLWSPRLSMYWAYWMSAVLLALALKPPVMIHPKFIRTLACVVFGIALFKFQVYFFKKSELSLFDIPHNISEVFNKNEEFEIHPEYLEAAKIAEQLPARYPVAPMYRVFGLFYKQDIVWLNALSSSYFKPRMILASYNNDEVPDVTSFMKDPFYMKTENSLNIYCEGMDTLYVSKAGVSGNWKAIESEKPD